MSGDEQCNSIREKYWSEINEIEKIERMRREVKRHFRQLNELREQIRKLKRHRHNQPDGEIFIPMNYGEYDEIPRPERSGDDVYF